MLRLVLSATYILGSLFISGWLLAPTAILLRVFGLASPADAFAYAVMRRWGRWAVLLAGGRVRIRGMEKLPRERNVCFYSNHQDLADIVLFLGWIGRPVGFIGKKELGMVPVMSTWMRLSHSLFLDRDSLREGYRVMARAARKIREGHAIVIFPEGHRNYGGALRDFKGGSFKISKMAGGKIVPVSIEGSWRFLNAKKGAVTGGDILITVHDAIDADVLTKDEWKDIPRRVQAAVASGLKPRELIRS
jgi:1-acyl-sn-glycerol-3-phosphate acyltransferase